MERTHLLSKDLAWVPARVRRMRHVVNGAAWLGTGAGIAATLAFVPGAAVAWKFLLAGGAGAVTLGERVARTMTRRQLGRMTRGELPLSDLDARAERDLVVVRGVIEADDLLPGLLLDTPGVYRRAVFKTRRTWVHEAAVDFMLVDADGTRIRVEAAGARWLTARRELMTYPGHRFATDGVPARVRGLVGSREEVEAEERVLAPGTLVQLVGTKTTTADVGGVSRDYRTAPQRATLTSGPDLPLVISRVDELRS